MGNVSASASGQGAAIAEDQEAESETCNDCGTYCGCWVCEGEH
jgi:hypothetical protein